MEQEPTDQGGGQGPRGVKRSPAFCTSATVIQPPLGAGLIGTISDDPFAIMWLGVVYSIAEFVGVFLQHKILTGSGRSPRRCLLTPIWDAGIQFRGMHSVVPGQITDAASVSHSWA